MGAGLRATFLIAALVSGASSGAGLSPASFSFLGVTNRVATPNGDGRNDNITFRFSNQRDAGGSVKIYDLRGHQVAGLEINPGDVSKVWNAQGMAAGVYVYVIRVDQTVVSGAVAVVR